MDVPVTLIALGAMLLLGSLTDLVGRNTPLPRVSLLLLLGFLCGPSVFALLPDFSESAYALVAHIALTMVGFLIGGNLTARKLSGIGRTVVVYSLSIALVTMGVVALGLTLLGASLSVALLLAGISSATAPAATLDVVRESGANGPFSRALIGIVALDDAWGLIAFSILLAVVQNFAGGNVVDTLLFGLWELCGALFLGVALGGPMAFLTGRLTAGEPTQAEAIGIIFLCAGLSALLNVSFLLTAIVLGSVVANLAKHHRRPFHEIEGIEWPFMVTFFFLAGASLRWDAATAAGWLVVAYVLLRVLGRVVGGFVGARFCSIEPLHARWMGPALLPQAGVALGMTIVATERVPDVAATLVPVVVAATMIFELIGPIVTKVALRATREIPN